MLKDKIAAFVEKIRAVEGVTACALVSRDGIIAGKYFDRDLNEPWFGALAATILASAESAGNLIGMKSLGTVRSSAQIHPFLSWAQGIISSSPHSSKARKAKRCMFAYSMLLLQKLGR